MRSGLRVLILLFVLLLVVGLTIGERMWVRSWDHPLEVAVYPIGVDDASRAFVGQLSGDDFRDIGSYLSDEARARWQQSIAPPRVVLEASIDELPPAPRMPAGGWRRCSSACDCAGMRSAIHRSGRASGGCGCSFSTTSRATTSPCRTRSACRRA